MTVAMSVSVQLTVGIWRAVGWKNDGLMGNGWADAWMDGLMGRWDSSFILGSKEAMYILHWKFLGSNIYLPDTGMRGGYPCTEGTHTEISKKPGPSHGDIECALCLTGGRGGQLEEMVVQEECPKGSATWTESWKDCQVQKRRSRQRGTSMGTAKSRDTRTKSRHQDSLLLGQEHRVTSMRLESEAEAKSWSALSAHVSSFTAEIWWAYQTGSKGQQSWMIRDIEVVKWVAA